MSRSVLLRLADIRDALDGIAARVAGIGFATYADTWGTQRTVERGLEIISEANRHVPDDLRAMTPGGAVKKTSVWFTNAAALSQGLEIRPAAAYARPMFEALLRD